MVKVFLMFACASMQVYWNSRMSAERGRVAAKCGPGEVVLDLCCGVGAFALLCARLDLAMSCHTSCQEMSRTVTVWREIHHIDRIKHRRKGCAENISRENMRKLTFLPLFFSF